MQMKRALRCCGNHVLQPFFPMLGWPFHLNQLHRLFLSDRRIQPKRVLETWATTKVSNHLTVCDVGTKFVWVTEQLSERVIMRKEGEVFVSFFFARSHFRKPALCPDLYMLCQNASILIVSFLDI